MFPQPQTLSHAQLPLHLAVIGRDSNGATKDASTQSLSPLNNEALRADLEQIEATAGYACDPLLQRCHMNSLALQNIAQQLQRTQEVYNTLIVQQQQPGSTAGLLSPAASPTTETRQNTTRESSTEAGLEAIRKIKEEMRRRLELEQAIERQYYPEPLDLQPSYAFADTILNAGGTSSVTSKLDPVQRIDAPCIPSEEASQRKGSEGPSGSVGNTRPETLATSQPAPDAAPPSSLPSQQFQNLPAITSGSSNVSLSFVSTSPNATTGPTAPAELPARPLPSVTLVAAAKSAPTAAPLPVQPPHPPSSVPAGVSMLPKLPSPPKFIPTQPSASVSSTTTQPPRNSSQPPSQPVPHPISQSTASQPLQSGALTTGPSIPMPNVVLSNTSSSTAGTALRPAVSSLPVSAQSMAPPQPPLFASTTSRPLSVPSAATTTSTGLRALAPPQLPPSLAGRPAPSVPQLPSSLLSAPPLPQSLTRQGPPQPKQ